MNKSPFPKPELPKKTLLGRLRTYFLTGIVVAVPVIITFYLVFWFVEWVDNWYDALVPEPYRLENHLPVNIPGLGIIFAVIFFTILGALTANFIGRSVIKAAESLVAHMPIVRAIYSALKQIFEAVFSSEKVSFKKVGIIQYPRPGIYALVFLADQTQGEIPHKLQQDMSTVFVPTTPNPTSGFLLFVPTKDIIMLDMGVEDAAKMIVSLGLVMPGSKEQTED